MTEKELYKKLEETGAVEKGQAANVVKAITDIIVEEAITDPKGVVLGKLGTFKSKDVAAKEGKKNVPNPMKPGTTYDIAAKPARKSLTFGFSKGAKAIGANGITSL